MTKRTINMNEVTTRVEALRLAIEWSDSKANTNCKDVYELCCIAQEFAEFITNGRMPDVD
jgi:hypothetical protein